MILVIGDIENTRLCLRSNDLSDFNFEISQFHLNIQHHGRKTLYYLSQLATFLVHPVIAIIHCCVLLQCVCIELHCMFVSIAFLYTSRIMQAIHDITVSN